jgi:tRNA A-37 threonylcarbamoyl transferase component Bud32
MTIEFGDTLTWPYAPCPGSASPSIDDLLADFERRWQNGETAADLLCQYPDIASRPEDAAALVFQEFVLRQSESSPPDLDYYVAKYPVLAPHLERFADAEDLMVSAQPALAESSPDAPDGYELLGVIGHGGMGVVYKARHRNLGRVVALKMILSGPRANTLEVGRFRNEASTAASLQHPGVVAVHDFGEHEGSPYFTMDFIDGPSLAEVVRHNALPAEQAGRYLLAVAEAVAHVHGRGVLHRDLKPANILVGPDDQPRVTDFGLARCLEKESTPGLTVSGQLVGTPSYMAPEQACGQHHLVGERTDVYSLGAVLYECLTGRPPFKAATLMDTLRQVVDDEPVAPRRLNAKVPADLETICLKCLQKEAGRRYASAGALAEDLRRFQAGEPIVARPVGRLARGWRWCRRNPAVASLLLAVFLSMAVGTGVAWAFALQADQARQAETLRAQEVLQARQSEAARAEQAIRAEAETDKERLRTEVEARARVHIEMEDILKMARLRLQSRVAPGPCEEAQAILNRVGGPRRLLPPGPDRDRLDLTARSLWAASLGTPDLKITRKELPHWGGIAVSWPIALRPDGKLMAIGTTAGPVLWERGRSVPDNLKPEDPRPRLAFSPDGQYLVEMRPEGGLRLHDHRVTRRLGEWTVQAHGPVLAVGFEPDGKHLLVCCADGWVEQLTLPALQDSAPGTFVGGQSGKWRAARFTGNAWQLAIGDADGRIAVWCAGKVTTRLSIPGRHPVSALAWSPGGEYLAVGTRHFLVHVFDMTDGTPVRELPQAVHEPDGVAFTTNGWLVAGAYGTSTLTVWDVERGEPVLTTDLHAGSISVSAHGRLLAGAGTDFACFGELRLPTIIRQLHGHRTYLSRSAWARGSHSGKQVSHLATLDAHFEMRVWNLDGSRCVDVFAAPRGDDRFYAKNAAVALSDDGRLLAYASGGEQRAEVVIRDVANRTDLARWPLPGGFSKLAHLAQDRFLLVREEFEPGKQTLESVVREVCADTPGTPRTLRKSEPSDVRRFLESDLTSAGRYYVWTGPRQPATRRRAEVWDVAKRQLIIRVPWPSEFAAQELGARLSDDGRYLELWGGDSRRYDLATKGSFLPFAFAIKTSMDGRWQLVDHKTSQISPSPVLHLRRAGEEQIWLELNHPDPDLGGFDDFTPNGRRLVWGRTHGTLCVADLAALEKEVTAFEKRVLRGSEKEGNRQE